MNLQLHSQATTDGQLVGVTPDAAGWKYLDFAALRLRAGNSVTEATGDREVALVLLGGVCDIESSAGSWTNVGRRAHVFAGRPFTVYLPIQTTYTIRAKTDLEVGRCAARAEVAHPARLIRPDEVEIEVRGGANITRQISHIIKPEFAAQRLLVVEVYTPSGNWSSYPPHKHDELRLPHEVILEETYYYRISTASGFAMQRLYTEDGTLDEAFVCRDGDLVLIPRGYHPVCAAPGSQVYYLNALAGDVHSMAASDDPDLAWIRGTWATASKDIDLVQ